MLVAGAKGWDEPPASGYKWVRRVKRLYQARVFVGPHSGSPRLNLGLYPNAREAWQAVKLWAATGRVPEGVLPTYVRKRPDGTYFARVTRNGRRVEVGPYPTPEAVVAELYAKLADLPPRPRRPRPPLSPAEAALLAAAQAAVGVEAVVRVTVTVRPADGRRRKPVIVSPPAN